MVHRQRTESRLRAEAPRSESSDMHHDRVAAWGGVSSARSAPVTGPDGVSAVARVARRSRGPANRQGGVPSPPQGMQAAVSGCVPSIARRIGEASNMPVERTAGSHSLATAAHWQRWAEMIA